VVSARKMMLNIQTCYTRVHERVHDVMFNQPRFLAIALFCVLSGLLFVACSKDEPTQPVDDQCAITVSSPAGGEVLVPGTTTTILWTAPSTIANVRITMHRGELEVGEIIAATENNGSYSWEVEDFGAGFGTGYFIRVSELAAHNICSGDSEPMILQGK